MSGEKINSPPTGRFLGRYLLSTQALRSGDPSPAIEQAPVSDERCQALGEGSVQASAL